MNQKFANMIGTIEIEYNFKTYFTQRGKPYFFQKIIKVLYAPLIKCITNGYED